METIKLNNDFSIPLIWRFDKSIFKILQLPFNCESAEHIGNLLMFDFSNSGSAYTVLDEKFNLPEELNNLFQKILILDIKIVENNEDLEIKTRNKDYTEVIVNLTRTYFQDINQINVMISESRTKKINDKFFELEIYIPEKVFLKMTNKEFESPLQNALRMLVFTLFGMLDSR
jgi:hypothetical protein